jgi:hypothetical protein
MLINWKEGGKHSPGQCSFHCTKPDSSAEKTAVRTLLHKDHERLSLTRIIHCGTYAMSRAMVTRRVIEVTFQIRMRCDALSLPIFLSHSLNKMRQIRSKAYRKLMAMYSTLFGFRQPYQVLGAFFCCQLAAAAAAAAAILTRESNPFLLTPDCRSLISGL